MKDITIYKLKKVDAATTRLEQAVSRLSQALGHEGDQTLAPPETVQALSDGDHGADEALRQDLAKSKAEQVRLQTANNEVEKRLDQAIDRLRRMIAQEAKL